MMNNPYYGYGPRNDSISRQQGPFPRINMYAQPYLNHNDIRNIDPYQRNHAHEFSNPYVNKPNMSNMMNAQPMENHMYPNPYINSPNEMVEGNFYTDPNPSNAPKVYPGLEEQEEFYSGTHVVPQWQGADLSHTQQHYEPIQMPQYTEPDMYIYHEGPIFNPETTQQHEHVHEFHGMTQSKDGHKHDFTGTTDPAPNEPNHTHIYWAVTKYDDEHRHELRGRTGPAIPVPGGGHIHELRGETYGYPNHQHNYTDKTQKSMGELPSYQY